MCTSHDWRQRSELRPRIASSGRISEGNTGTTGTKQLGERAHQALALGNEAVECCVDYLHGFPTSGLSRDKIRGKGKVPVRNGCRTAMLSFTQRRINRLHSFLMFHGEHVSVVPIKIPFMIPSYCECHADRAFHIPRVNTDYLRLQLARPGCSHASVNTRCNILWLKKGYNHAVGAVNSDRNFRKLISGQCGEMRLILQVLHHLSSTYPLSLVRLLQSILVSALKATQGRLFPGAMIRRSQKTPKSSIDDTPFFEKRMLSHLHSLFTSENALEKLLLEELLPLCM